MRTPGFTAELALLTETRMARYALCNNALEQNRNQVVPQAKCRATCVRMGDGGWFCYWDCT